MVFLASRIYAGYAPPLSLNNEPFAYQSGFAVKWLIAAQIAQMSNGGVPVDARAGDLNYGTVAPWIAWGPYLWANGTTPRSDGLTWIPSDFGDDLTHPSGDGIAKVGHYLMDYFAGSPYTKCWFTVGAAGCDQTTSASLQAWPGSRLSLFPGATKLIVMKRLSHSRNH